MKAPCTAAATSTKSLSEARPYSWRGWRRPGAPPSPSLFSISYSRYSSPCCRQADGGASFLLLERVEEARSATCCMMTAAVVRRFLINSHSSYFSTVQGVRLTCSMMAAAVLRRHLMVWKIFAPRFIFEGLGRNKQHQIFNFSPFYLI